MLIGGLTTSEAVLGMLRSGRLDCESALVMLGEDAGEPRELPGVEDLLDDPEGRDPREEKLLDWRRAGRPRVKSRARAA